jgi:hypothetical protein
MMIVLHLSLSSTYNNTLDEVIPNVLDRLLFKHKSLCIRSVVSEEKEYFCVNRRTKYIQSTDQTRLGKKQSRIYLHLSKYVLYRVRRKRNFSLESSLSKWEDKHSIFSRMKDEFCLLWRHSSLCCNIWKPFTENIYYKMFLFSVCIIFRYFLLDISSWNYYFNKTFV